MDAKRREQIALWRLSILGALISARLSHGDRQAYFKLAASRTHEHPDGRFVKLSARTIESWHYAYQGGGFDALKPKSRQDRGGSRAIAPELAKRILQVKRENPERSVRRIIKLLERAGEVTKDHLKRSTVHRLLKAHGISEQPKRGASVERRSFLPAHAGDLWMADAMHGPIVIAPDSKLRKSYLLSQLDAATRFVPHSYFALSEAAIDHEYGFKQALLKHGRPRTYYVDLGAAYRAHSLQLICAELGIAHVLCDAGDCEAKGAIERFHRTWRAEVGSELPKEPIPLAELNAKHWAWLAIEYHHREHGTTGRAPMQHWLAEAHELRALPLNKNLDEVFLHRVDRTVRKDGTVQFRGMLLEVRAELSRKAVELRFDPAAAADDETALPKVFINDDFYCDTVLLDRVRNSTRRRRRRRGASEPINEPSGLDPLGLLEAEHYERTRPITGDIDEED